MSSVESKTNKKQRGGEEKTGAEGDHFLPTKRDGDCAVFLRKATRGHRVDHDRFVAQASTLAVIPRHDVSCCCCGL